MRLPLLRAFVIFASALTVITATAGTSAAAEPGNTAFERTWNRTDRPVIEQRVSRTWMWGPAPITGPMMEATTDRPASGREVQYFDKSRMERSLDPSISQWSIWYVTNGLLARELVTGQLQLGNDDFLPRDPATVNVAGDWDDPTGPTYATFAGLLTAPAQEVGTTVTSRVDRSGSIADDRGLAGQGVTATYFVPETGHTVASPFWNFMNASGLVQENGPPRNGALFPNAFYATGFPITEAYWANVKVGNEYTDVLIQVFERRVLTYTPGNPEGWQVEAGNVGRHYFEWRYGVSPADSVTSTPPGLAPLGPTPPGSNLDSNGTTITFANGGTSPLTIQISGPEVTEITIEGCPECQPAGPPPQACHPAAQQETLTLPEGTYSVTVTRPGAVQPMGGAWTFLPDTSYGACFFTFR